MSNMSNDLKKYHDAVASEFEVKNSRADELKQSADDKLIELLPDAQHTLEHLLSFAESESVRWSVAKYVFDNALGKTGTGSGSDLEKLVRSLQSEPAK